MFAILTGLNIIFSTLIMRTASAMVTIYALIQFDKTSNKKIKPKG